MTEKQVFVLSHRAARSNAIEAVRAAPDGCAVIIQDPTRTLSQNDAQWPYLEGFARTVQWPVNGEMVYLEREEWKDILTAAFEGETNPRLARGWDGGVVMLGRRTRNYGKRRFSEWMEWLKAAAALKGVEPYYAHGREEVDA